ncbi:sigma factor-like helix-turn-helix DNA-binding protein [Lactiplantibacillus plantarum]|uniref:sigma factor-like helix-turn-helix DNA-binding protein n=1 Tax=Lactiplantibacillus plantarum TaxID=1590 RepID=UPI00404598AB
MEPSVEARALILEALEQVCELLDTLPMTSRRIFLMAQLDGMSNGEIAERLGLTPNAVQKSLARALVRSSDCIAPPGRAMKPSAAPASARWRIASTASSTVPTTVQCADALASGRASNSRRQGCSRSIRRRSN